MTLRPGTFENIGEPDKDERDRRIAECMLQIGKFLDDYAEREVTGIMLIAQVAFEDGTRRILLGAGPAGRLLHDAAAQLLDARNGDLGQIP